jgi:hypothetical protein
VGEDDPVTPLDLGLDAVLGNAAAVDLARAAVLEVAPAEQVGEHVGVLPDADPALATHRFACTSSAYAGWHWSVTVVRAPGEDTATVSEVVLLPGDGALLPPAWVPWNERVRPGDLGPGDLHPTSPLDPRLEAGCSGEDFLEELDDPASPLATLRPEQWELGLGRERVLSVHGRDLAAQRWYDGDHGPASPMAKAAPASCTSCGFLVPIGGLLGQAFGVCANPFGADGSVVALEYGCGAHSSVREIEGTGIPVTEIVVDDYGFVEVHARLLVADAAPDVVVTSQVVIDEPTDDEPDAELDHDEDVDRDAELADPDALLDAHLVDDDLLDVVDDLDDLEDSDGGEDADDADDSDDEDDADDEQADERETALDPELADVIDIDPDDL